MTSSMTRTRSDRAERAIWTAGMGAVAGGVIGLGAGVAARVAMRLFALATGPSVSFTLGGTMIILLFGGIIGLGAGVTYVLVRRFLPGPAVIRGALFALLLVAFVVTPGFLRQPGEAAPSVALGIVLFSAITALYGPMLAVAVLRAERRVVTVGGRVAALLLLGALGGILGIALLVMAMAPIYLQILADLGR